MIEVDIQQSGADVVASASGSIDLTDLTYGGVGYLSYDFGHYILPSFASFVLGPRIDYDLYSHIDEPSSFGRGDNTIAWTNDGELLAIGSGYLGVPVGYMSGAPLTAGSTYQNETFDSLGLTPGTSYLYTWGAGAHADSLTINIGAAITPEPATWVMLILGFAAVLALRGARKRAWMGEPE